MKASELVDIKTQLLMSKHPGMAYEKALNHVLDYDKTLRNAYAGDLEVTPSAEELQFAQIMNPLSPEVIAEIVRRIRQARQDGTIDRVDGSLGRLARRAFLVSSGQGLEIGSVVEELIRRGDPDAPLAAAELALAPQVAGGKFSEQNRRFCAGVTISERAEKLAETRLAEGKPELTFSGLVQEVLDSDPQLKADYTGFEV